VPNVPSAKSGY
jgi:hypothetical protein